MKAAILLCTVGLYAASAFAQPNANSPAPVAVAPTGPTVYTIDGQRIDGEVTAIEEGRLIIGPSSRSVPIDEVERIEMGNVAGLKAEWIGQDNHDLVKVGRATGGNGVQDVHVRLVGLFPDRQIKQIVAERRQRPPLREWRLNPSQSSHWRIGAERPVQATVAELYLEPTNTDMFGMTFDFTITYDDSSTAEASVTSTTHTSHQLKVDAGTAPTAVAAPSVVAAPDERPSIAVHLEGRSLVRGRLVALDDTAVTLRTPWQAEHRIPLVGVTAITFGAAGQPEASAALAERLQKPADEDTAIVLDNQQKPAEVTGSLDGYTDGQVRFTYAGQSRGINPARLVGVVFAAHPPVRSATAPYQECNLVSGEKLSGQLKAITPEAVELDAGWDSPVLLPRSSITQIRFRNGKMVYLSDVEPIQVVETPYFSRLMPYRRDMSLTGGPLKMNGATHAKGLAVHARSVLTYPLDGQYETFRAMVGFDDEAQERGRAVCRVLGDGRELFAQPDLRADQDPVAVEVSVAGVGQLSLEVDFGEAEDIGDRVIWADARILRAGKPAE
jgi:hypothetical protein